MNASLILEESSPTVTSPASTPSIVQRSSRMCRSASLRGTMCDSCSRVGSLTKTLAEAASASACRGVKREEQSAAQGEISAAFVKCRAHGVFLRYNQCCSHTDFCLAGSSLLVPTPYRAAPDPLLMRVTLPGCARAPKGHGVQHSKAWVALKEGCSRLLASQPQHGTCVLCPLPR
jgi:hypothetical protein